MIKTIHHWKNIALVEETIIYPNGQTLVHTTIKHPGAAVILPITADKRIIVIRQFRPSLKNGYSNYPQGPSKIMKLHLNVHNVS